MLHLLLYRHLMLSDITSHKHPVMAGPNLIHQKNSLFNYFAKYSDILEFKHLVQMGSQL